MSDKMPGLTLADLAGAREQVPVGEGTVEVRGISTKVALSILQKFPHLAKLANGFKIADLLSVAPDAVATIIAAGVGKFGDPEAEEQASDIPLEIQYDIVEAIGRLTFKSGFAPFMERVLRLARVAKSDLSTRAPSTNSQVTLKNSSLADTDLAMSGTTPPDKSPLSSSSLSSGVVESDTNVSPISPSLSNPETARA